MLISDWSSDVCSSDLLAMILAVLEARCGLSFSSSEVYLNIAGGYRVTDPAADLAVAAAPVSALSERPVSADAVAFGEVSLSGEVRPVAHGRSEEHTSELQSLMHISSADLCLKKKKS